MAATQEISIHIPPLQSSPVPGNVEQTCCLSQKFIKNNPYLLKKLIMLDLQMTLHKFFLTKLKKKTKDDDSGFYKW